MTLLDRVEDVKGALHVLIDVEDGSDVAAAVAIVGGTPHGDQVGVLEPVLEAVHDQLMGSGDQVEAVNVVELRGNL